MVQEPFLSEETVDLIGFPKEKLPTKDALFFQILVQHS